MNGLAARDRSAAPSPETIGSVIAGRSARLLDPITLRPAEHGRPGMIVVAGRRGVDLFRGYLDDPATTGKSFFTDDAGVEWFLTGDLARATADDRWIFTGRIDDVIKVAGENVSLTEVEAAIAEAPGVLEAAVIAVADPVRDVVPAAYVVSHDPAAPPSVETLRRWADDNLSPAARPRSWTVVDALPRTSVGKIRRFAIGAQQ
ncbi:MAG: fatty acid--CoA ligase family protein [Pirellulales bacterium]